MPYVDLDAIRRQAGLGSNDKTPKTNEEKFKKEHEEEKRKAQEEVDAVINSSVYTREELSSKKPLIPDKFPVRDKSDVKTDGVYEELPVKDPVDISVEINANDHFSSITDDFTHFKASNNSSVQTVLPSDINEPAVVKPDDIASDTDLLDDDPDELASRDEQEYDDAEDYEDEYEEDVRKPETKRRVVSAKGGNKSSSDSKKVSGKNIGKSYLRDFPSSIANYARTLFPSANNISEAVAAYIYRFEKNNLDINSVPENIRIISEDYIGDNIDMSDVQGTMLEEMERLRTSVNKSINRLSAIELGIIYALFDRMGFRKKRQDTPGEVDFLEAGVGDLLTRLESQAAHNEQRRKERDGRPKR